MVVAVLTTGPVGFGVSLRVATLFKVTAQQRPTNTYPPQTKRGFACAELALIVPSCHRAITDAGISRCLHSCPPLPSACSPCGRVHANRGRCVVHATTITPPPSPRHHHHHHGTTTTITSPPPSPRYHHHHVTTTTTTTAGHVKWNQRNTSKPGPSITHYKSKWRSIWIRDVFCYSYAQDMCPIMALVHDRALVLGV